MYSSLLFFNNRSALPTKRQIGLEFSHITAAEYALCFFPEIFDDRFVHFMISGTIFDVSVESGSKNVAECVARN